MSKWHLWVASGLRQAIVPMINPNDEQVFPSRFVPSQVSPVSIFPLPHVDGPSVHPVMKQLVQLIVPFKLSMSPHSFMPDGSSPSSHSSPGSIIVLPQTLQLSLHVPSEHISVPDGHEHIL